MVLGSPIPIPGPDQARFAYDSYDANTMIFKSFNSRHPIIWVYSFITNLTFKMKIVFYVSTGLLSLMMLYSSIGMYLLNTSAIQGIFESLGFPAFLVIPLALMKIAGVITLLTRFHPIVKEWAYAGFFFNFVLAAAAHIHKGDGEAGGAIVALVLLIISYITEKRAFTA